MIQYFRISDTRGDQLSMLDAIERRRNSSDYYID